MRFFRVISEIKYKYLFYGSYVRVAKGSVFFCGKKSKIRHSRIYIASGTISIEDSCMIRNAIVFVNNGSLSLGKSTLLNGKPSLEINVDHGAVHIENHCRVQCSRIWVRFNGSLSVGHYTNINSGSEIRADEEVKIGDYCMISYSVNIWDTNTHVIMEPSRRAELTRIHYPYFGFEKSKPGTKPVIIKNGCWIGEKATIMRGTILEDNVIVGYNTMVVGKTIEPDTTVVEEVKLKEFPNKYHSI